MFMVPVSGAGVGFKSGDQWSNVGTAPESFSACALGASLSQQLEDVLLLPTLMRAVGGLRKPGVFVELGALDGKKFSNTFMLERCFGWRGILIEANPINFARLNASGRPTCVEGRCIHSAVCKEGVGSLRMSLDGGETAGELDFLTKRRQKSRAKRTVDVPCEPLSSLMARYGLASADFLSLDVEGAEGKVLETVDPHAFKVAMVEALSSAVLVRQLMHRAQMVRSVNATVPFSDVWLRPGVEEVPVSGIFHPGRLGAMTETKKVSVLAPQLALALRRAVYGKTRRTGYKAL